MTKYIPKNPRLLKCPDSENPSPMVLGGKCRCGHTYFPPHLFGCEVCGAGPESLTISEFPARGRLISYTAAHLHMRYDGTKPLFIGKIILENGPSIIAGLDATEEKEIRDCDIVNGTLIELLANDKGEKIVDLYFKPEAAKI